MSVTGSRPGAVRVSDSRANSDVDNVLSLLCWGVVATPNNLRFWGSSIGANIPCSEKLVLSTNQLNQAIKKLSCYWELCWKFATDYVQTPLYALRR